MTPEVPGRGLVVRQEVGWNEEWRAISGDSLAVAVYQTHKSRVAANAALEMGPMLASGEADLAELELVMETARAAAVKSGLAAGGSASRDTDVRGFARKFVPEQLRRIRGAVETEDSGEQERQSQRYLVQTGLMMVNCFESRWDPIDLFEINELMPSLIESLKIVGLTGVPQETVEMGLYLRRQAEKLGLSESMFSFNEVPLPKADWTLKKVLIGEMVYALARHPGVRRKLATDGPEFQLCQRLLSEALKDGLDYSYERGVGPNGETVTGFNERAQADGVRIGRLFPGYLYKDIKYWAIDQFPYRECPVPRDSVFSENLSIYNFHLRENLPKHILKATAAEGPEKLRMVLARWQAGHIRLLRQLDGLSMPAMGIELDGRNLGQRLEEIGGKFAEDEEMMNYEAMLWQLRDPLEIIENPEISKFIDFRGDSSWLFLPDRFPLSGSSEQHEKWISDKGDTPRAWVCLQIAKKLLPHLARLEQAEKEGRVEIMGRLKLILRHPGTETRNRLPQLGVRLDRLGTRGARSILLEELLAAYQPDEQSLKALVEADGVNLRIVTFEEIRRTGGCLTLPEAMAKVGNEQLRQLLAEAILANESSLFESRIDGVGIGLSQMLGYGGWLSPEYLPQQRINIGGREEAMAEAVGWLKQQPARAREYWRYLIVYRLLRATASGLIDWPSNQSEAYRDAAKWLRNGKDYPHRYPAAGALMEYLSDLDSANLGFKPEEVEAAMTKFRKLGLEFDEWKYDKWWSGREASRWKRRGLLERQNRSAWRQNSEWMGHFLTASYKVCELVARKLQEEMGLEQAERGFAAGLESLADLELRGEQTDAKALRARFMEMRAVFSRLPIGSRLRAEVMKNVAGQLGAEGEKMRKARKSDEQIFEEWLKQVFIPLYRRVVKK